MIADRIVVFSNMLQYVLFLTLILAGRGEVDEARLVNIEQGPVRGYKLPGMDIFAFYGIPYATAPTGSNKFKAPLPPPKWSEPFEAVNSTIVCPQSPVFPAFPISSFAVLDDCLIANIYVPDTTEDNLPVLVYVHGGAYQIMSGDSLRPTALIKQTPMIVVNFNYRLGPHGFLCLGTPDAPGNAGMKDQVALLRWVKRNIANFGGNANDVTIIGYSAGSSAVDLLMLSPMTKGLFNKVIPESGANVAVFSVQIDPIENARNYAKLLNFTDSSDDVYALGEFYKSVPRDVLHSINLLTEKDSTFVFSPCIERDIGEEIFLDDSPVNILKNGKQQKLPMLYGFAEMEGLFRIQLFDIWKDNMNSNFSDFLPADLHFDSEEEKEEVAQKVKNFYFGGQTVNEGTIFRYIDYFTDVIFAYPTLRSVRLQVESGNNNIYLYQYNFVDDIAPLIPYTDVRGADHCAQTFGIVDGVSMVDFSEDNLSEEYKNMKKLMRKIWINFITTSNPVPEGSELPKWPPSQANGGPYMILDQTIKLGGPLLQQRALFWDDIYEEYYRFPSQPHIPNTV